LKNHLYKGENWKSIKGANAFDEAFDQMRKIITLHWKTGMTSPEEAMLMNWLQSLIEEHVKKIAKVTKAANKFGV
jgi:hypothetical protein